jgi:hypothetical protein
VFLFSRFALRNRAWNVAHVERELSENEINENEIREHKHTKQSRSIQPQFVFAPRVSQNQEGEENFVKISSSEVIFHLALLSFG